MAINKATSDTKRSEQSVLVNSFDEDYNILAVETVEFNPSGTIDRKVSSNITTRLDDTTTANVTYIGKAAIGTATSAASWQIQKIDETTGMVITWADGNASFDNIWDSRSSLTYS